LEQQRLAAAAEAAATKERMERQRLEAAAEAAAAEERAAAELAAQAEAEVAAALATLAEAEVDAEANTEATAAQSKLVPEILDPVRTNVEECIQAEFCDSHPNPSADPGMQVGGSDSCPGLEVAKSVQIEEAVPLRSLAVALSKDNMKEAPEPEAVLPSYTLEQLTNPHVWQKIHINPAERELLLPDSTFKQLFCMDKKAFGELQKWKRQSLKKKHGLF